MTSSDPIADMLTRIRNAIMVRKQQTVVPYSNIKKTILDVLKREGYIVDYKIEDDGSFKELIVTVRNPKENAKISHLEKISKPGLRVYAKSNEIPTVLSGKGEVIVSTSQGLMVGQEAKKRKLGGELICKVY